MFSLNAIEQTENKNNNGSYRSRMIQKSTFNNEKSIYSIIIAYIREKVEK